MLYFDDIKIPCKEEVIFSLANEENLDMLDVHNTVRAPCNSVSLGTKEKIFRFYSLNIFQKEWEDEYTTEGCFNDDTIEDYYRYTCSGFYDYDPSYCGQFDTEDFIAANACCACGGNGNVETDDKLLYDEYDGGMNLNDTTKLFLTMMLNGNDYISNTDDLLRVINYAEMFKDVANAAMFSVADLIIDTGLDYVKYKDTGSNATYELSYKVQDSRYMYLDTDADVTKKELESPTKVREDSFDSTPIYLDQSYQA